MNKQQRDQYFNPETKKIQNILKDEPNSITKELIYSVGFEDYNIESIRDIYPGNQYIDKRNTQIRFLIEDKDTNRYKVFTGTLDNIFNKCEVSGRFNTIEELDIALNSIGKSKH